MPVQIERDAVYNDYVIRFIPLTNWRGQVLSMQSSTFRAVPCDRVAGPIGRSFLDPTLQRESLEHRPRRCRPLHVSYAFSRTDMNILDLVEIWMRSLHATFEAGGLEVRCERSPREHLNPSYALNLRRGDLEADLIVWQSGEADLSLMDTIGSVSQQHFDDLHNPDELVYVLATVAGVLPAPKLE